MWKVVISICKANILVEDDNSYIFVCWKVGNGLKDIEDSNVGGVSLLIAGRD